MLMRAVERDILIKLLQGFNELWMKSADIIIDGKWWWINAAFTKFDSVDGRTVETERIVSCKMKRADVDDLVWLMQSWLRDFNRLLQCNVDMKSADADIEEHD